MSDETSWVARRSAGPEESARASRTWWEKVADEYQEEHGDFLGDSSFVWGPEGLTEKEARLLGPPERMEGARVLEVGCGAAQCARWLQAQGAHVVGVDVAFRQLQHSHRIDENSEPTGAHGSTETTGADGRTRSVRVPVAQADAQYLPFADASFEVVCSAFGALPFVPDAGAAVAECARVLRPGGRLVFSVTHPVRWMFPDDPTRAGMTVEQSYFDRRAYIEEDRSGRAVYVEHHHTMGDWVSAIAGAGLRLVRLTEPEWPDENTSEWGGWGPYRGRYVPGTAIFTTEK